MRNVSLLSYLTISFGLLSLMACDPVSESDRYIEMAPVEAHRSVLLEEFTGQYCPNCPTAHRTIEALQEQYGESLISVSIHAGSFAIPEGAFNHSPVYFSTFLTPEGNQYADEWGVTSYPCGIVNRTGGVQMHTDWATSIREAISKPSELDIQLSASVADGKVKSEVQLLPAKDLDGKLQVWLVEDSIASIQKDGAMMLTNYVHNNVYRASFNGVGGTPVSLRQNVFQNYSYELSMDGKDWNSARLSVVAFVYNQQGVSQVRRSFVTIPE